MSELEVQEVQFGYGQDGKKGFQIENLSFTIKSPCQLAIVGPNGSGKSTLMLLMAGLLKPTSGRILLDGRDIVGYSSRERACKVAYMPQKIHPLMGFRVWDVVSLGRYPHTSGLGFTTSDDQKVIHRVMEKTQVDSLSQRFFHQLSGGEQQRVLLACVLAQEPEILLLDEPTSSLDVDHKVRIFALLSMIVQQGIGVVVITHDLDLAALYCEQVMVMQKGKLIESGPPEKVFQREIIEKLYGNTVVLVAHPSENRPMMLPNKISIDPRSKYA